MRHCVWVQTVAHACVGIVAASVVVLHRWRTKDSK